MGGEHSKIPSPTLKKDSDATSSSTGAFPFVRGSREARLRSHQVLARNELLLRYSLKQNYDCSFILTTNLSH